MVDVTAGQGGGAPSSKFPSLGEIGDMLKRGDLALAFGVLTILVVLILLIAFGPALVAVGSQEIAELVLGCQVDLNRVIPCVIGGKDYGQTFYDLASPFAILICRFRPVSCSLCSGRLQPRSCSWAGSPTAAARRPELPLCHVEDSRHPLP